MYLICFNSILILFFSSLLFSSLSFKREREKTHIKDQKQNCIWAVKRKWDLLFCFRSYGGLPIERFWVGRVLPQCCWSNRLDYHLNIWRVSECVRLMRWEHSNIDKNERKIHMICECHSYLNGEKRGRQQKEWEDERVREGIWIRILPTFATIASL